MKRWADVFGYACRREPDVALWMLARSPPEPQTITFGELYEASSHGSNHRGFDFLLIGALREGGHGDPIVWSTRREEPMLRPSAASWQRVFRMACLEAPKTALWMLERNPPYCQEIFATEVFAEPTTQSPEGWAEEVAVRSALFRALLAQGADINRCETSSTWFMPEQAALEFICTYRETEHGGCPWLEDVLAEPSLDLDRPVMPGWKGGTAEGLAEQVGNAKTAARIREERAHRQRWSELRAAWTTSVVRRAAWTAAAAAPETAAEPKAAAEPEAPTKWARIFRLACREAPDVALWLLANGPPKRQEVTLCEIFDGLMREKSNKRLIKALARRGVGIRFRAPWGDRPTTAPEKSVPPPSEDNWRRIYLEACTIAPKTARRMLELGGEHGRACTPEVPPMPKAENIKKLCRALACQNAGVAEWLIAKHQRMPEAFTTLYGALDDKYTTPLCEAAQSMPQLALKMLAAGADPRRAPEGSGTLLVAVCAREASGGEALRALFGGAPLELPGRGADEVRLELFGRLLEAGADPGDLRVWPFGYVPRAGENPLAALLIEGPKEACAGYLERLLASAAFDGQVWTAQPGLPMPAREFALQKGAWWAVEMLDAHRRGRPAGP